MKKVLGLDLGSSSIGWAFVRTQDDGSRPEIVDVGVRLIPLTVDEKAEFDAGNAISKHAKRTMKRTIRKGYDRYQARRADLRRELTQLNMLPDDNLLLFTDSLTLYALRDRGVREKLSLPEIGRVLCLLNQKRGYKSLRGTEGESEDGKKVTDYEQEINGRYGEIKSRGITIGQLFYEKLQQDRFARLKQLVFPRNAYIEEYNAVMKKQQDFYPDVLTDEVIARLRDSIIYYQRPLKSKKGLVSVCEFVGKRQVSPETGRPQWVGPRVAPRSSPLSEVCRIWESINNITIQDRNGKEREISIEEKQTLFDALNTTELLKEKAIFKLLGIKDKEFTADELTHENGILGYITRCKLSKAFGEQGIHDKWLQFDLKTQDRVNKETGEIMGQIDPSFEREPLYQLWHVLYSVKEKEVLLPKLMDKFGFDEDTAKRLMRIDFTRQGFANKSARAMRLILPALQEGQVYSEAMAAAGLSHSGSKTKEQAAAIAPIDKLDLLEKNSLRQPVVEKVLNQLVNVVNAIISDPAMGKPDEIRIELARELKQSKEERNRTYTNNSKRDRENRDIIRRLEEHGIKGSRKNVERYRLWREFNELSVYGPYDPERKIGFAQAFDGSHDIDHIIPQSRLFDDSFSNKVFCSRKQNQDKGNQTAWDYMNSRGEEALSAYLAKVDELYKSKNISRAKRDKLLMSSDAIPEDFINRQLNETRYIVRKAKEILAPLLPEKEHSIVSTSGSVTAFLRHEWGWDDVLVDLNYDKYPEGQKSQDPDEQGRKRKKIENWSKRDDHRHHAIDALAIAFTDRSVIQKMNSLNQILREGTSQNENLRAYAQKIRPFSTRDVGDSVSRILISLKSGKKVATKSKNKASGQVTYAPRGPLSEESVYGIITINGVKEYVIKYKLGMDFKLADLDYIVDKGVRVALERRLAEFDNDPKQAFRNLDDNPVWFNEKHKIPIKTIRMRTNLKVVEPISYDISGTPIGFVKPGNNHHIALYENEQGRRIEKVVTFWESVVRKKQGLPVIDKDPKDGMTFLTSMQQNEMFIFNMTRSEIEDAVASGNFALLSKNLFRVRKLTSGNYWFNHHLETGPRESVADKKARRCIQASASSMTGIKVRVNHLGKISKIGE
ncbi:MAG: type II CRISPR RNA-guided endonuclease Cas9 [Bacteroidetes bacterium]|nr:type II CRISPR RNA-guided endonuclease Cas9 [Bacteroidota bacterium]